VIRDIFAVRKNHKTGGNTGRGKQKNEKTKLLMRERRATQTREINGRGSTREKRTKKASEKLNTDISARRRQKAKRAGLAGVGGESSFRSKICSNC